MGATATGRARPGANPDAWPASQPDTAVTRAEARSTLAQAALAAGRERARRTSVPCKVVTSGSPVRAARACTPAGNHQWAWTRSAPRPTRRSGQGAGAQQPGQGQGPAGRRRPAVHLARVGQPLGRGGRVPVAADRDPVQPLGRGQPLGGRGDRGHLDALVPQGGGQPQQEPAGHVARRSAGRRGPGTPPAGA